MAIIGGADSDLLSDNFDDNDISDWETPVGTVVAANQRVEVSHVGTGTDRIRKSFTSSTEVWESYDFIVASGTWSDGQASQGGGITNFGSYAHLAFVTYAKGSGVMKWKVEYGTDAGATTVDTSTEFLVDTKYEITIHWKAATSDGANDGITEVWVDAVLLYSKTDIDSDTLAATGILLGNNYGDITDTDFYFDNMRVGTTGVAPTVSPEATLLQLQHHNRGGFNPFNGGFAS